MSGMPEAPRRFTWRGRQAEELLERISAAAGGADPSWVPKLLEVMSRDFPHALAEAMSRAMETGPDVPKAAPQRCLNCGSREGESCQDWCAYKPGGRFQ